MDINNIIMAVVVVGGIGLIFGLLLAFAAHIFAVKKDERAEKIQAVLPGANCGSAAMRAVRHMRRRSQRATRP